MNKKLFVLLGAATLALTGCNTNANDNDDSNKDDGTVIDTSIAITFEGKDLAFAVGLPEKANQGDTVNFRVTALSGYEIVDVKVTDENGEEVTLTGNKNSGFSFVMPSTQVKVSATAQGAYFHVDMLDKSKVVITPENYASGQKTVSSFIGGYIIDNSDKIQTGDYVYARAGQEVAILVNQVWFADGLKVTVNNEEVEKENYIVYDEVDPEAEEGTEPTIKYEYNAYKFTMPNENVSIDVTSSGEKAINVVSEENEKLTTNVYKLVDGEKVTTSQFYAGETAYVDVTLKDAYVGKNLVKTCKYNYSSVSSYNVKTTDTSSSASSKVSGTYYYSVTSFTNYTTDITLSFELQESKYENKEFVGSYFGKEFYSTKFPDSYKRSITIDNFGNALIDSSTKGEIDATTLDETNKSFKITAGYSSYYMHYDGKIAWMPYSGTSTNDIYVLIKGVTSWDDITLNKNSDASMYDDNTSKKYLVFVEFVDNSTSNVIGNIVKVDGAIYLNVTLKNGDTTYTPADVTVASNFDIYKGDTKLATHTGTAE